MRADLKRFNKPFLLAVAGQAGFLVAAWAFGRATRALRPGSSTLVNVFLFALFAASVGCMVQVLRNTSQRRRILTNEARRQLLNERLSRH